MRQSASTNARDPHQADHIIRAFRYQLLQTIQSWMDLSNEEELWIERTEDFSVTSTDTARNVQVKHSEASGGPTPVSLRTPGVRDAILRFWEGSPADARRNYLTIISRSGVATERSAPLPGQLSGIEYWTMVAERGETQPLRELLLDVFQGSSLGEWLASKPNDQDLRDLLLTRIHFALDAKDDAALEQVIHDRLVATYLDKHHFASTAAIGMSILVDRTFKVASLPDASKRRLTRADLHLTLEKAIPRLGALDQAALLSGVARTESAPQLAIAVHELRVRPGAIDRHIVVSALEPRIATAPIAWLKGSTGVGKSTLAGLIARARGGSWIICDFRYFAGEGEQGGVIAAWRELMTVLNRDPSITCVILDDLSARGADLLKLRIAGLGDMIRSRGGQVLVTSNHTPSGALLSELGIGSPAVIDAPYFTVEEVRELVAITPSPAIDLIDAWATMIHLTTANGHPLLTVAKIASLRERNWPRAALTEDIGPSVSAGIASARADARLRLLADLTTPEQRALLGRAGAVFLEFDDSLVFKLCHAQPLVANPGDALAPLKGSWIEPTADGYMRLSPLIADLQRDMPAADALRWRQIAAEHWMANRTLNEKTLPLAFWNGFLGKHPWVLLKLSEVILTLPPETLHVTAAMLSPLALLRTDASLWPELPPLAATLRLIQIRVADAVEDELTAAGAAQAWLREIEYVEHDGIQSLTIMTAPPTFFELQHVRLPITIQLTFLLRLQTAIAAAETNDNLDVRESAARMQRMLPPNADFPGFLMTQLLMRVRGSEDFESIIQALDTIDSSTCTKWLNTASKILEGAGVWVHNSWAIEQLSGKELSPSLERYERIGQIVAKWKDTDLEAEFYIARSIILDEGLNNPNDALTTIDSALVNLGHKSSLIRQKCKILSRRGDAPQSAKLFLSIEVELSGLYPFERMLALRDGAVACANAGRLNDAVRIFTAARAVLEAQGIRPDLRIGLTLELALVRWAQDQRHEAFLLIMHAFEDLERIDSAATRQSRYTHRVACAMPIMFGNTLRESFGADVPTRIVFGRPSEIKSAGEPENDELPSLQRGWMMLELAEAECGENTGISERAQKRLPNEGFDLSLSAMLAQARFRSALEKQSIEASVAAIKPMAESYERLAASKSNLVGPIYREALQGALTDIILFHALRGSWTDETARLLSAVVRTKWGEDSEVLPLIQASNSNLIDTSAMAPVTYCSLVRPLLDELNLTPGARFVRDLYLAQAATTSNSHRLLEPLVVRRLTEGWRNVLARQRFLLISPQRTATQIELALTSMEKIGLSAASELFTAISSSVGIGFSDQWKSFFDRLRAQRETRAV